MGGGHTREGKKPERDRDKQTDDGLREEGMINK